MWGVARIVWSTFIPRPNGQFLALRGVRTLDRMVCALFSSFVWQSVGWGWRGDVKLFGQCPYGSNTFQEGASLNTKAPAVLINSTNTKTNIQKILNTNKRVNFAFNKYKDKYKHQIKGTLCIWPYMQIVGDLWNRLVAPQSLLCALNTHFRLSRKTRLALLLFTEASISDE